MNKKILILGLIILFPFSLFSQYAFVNSQADEIYEDGMEYFEQKQYTAAQNKFEEYQKHVDNERLKVVNAEYYSALISIYLYHSNGEKQVKSFVESNPTHPKASEAYFELGNFYFREKNYAKAIQYYEKTAADKLRGEDKTHFQFKIAYAYFSRRAFDEALPYFNQLKRRDNQYQSAANYYAGYIHFEQKNFDEALIDLERAAKNDAYTISTANMIANIYYQKQEYDKLIAYAEDLLPRLSRIEALNIKLIIGDAYFEQNDFKRANEYFEEYRKESKSKLDRELLYRMGYVALQLKDFEEAITLFEAVGIAKDSLSQYNAYYLGGLYLRRENFRFASNAYEQAKLLNYNNEIAEESHFQLAKLNLRQGNTASAVTELSSFIEKYPRSSYLTQAKELLSEAYLNSNAYDQAIAFLESIDNKSLKLKEAYQKVTFYQGAEFFNQADYYRAMQFFKKSVEYPQNKSLLGETYFWMGESFSTGKKFEEAINSYLKSMRNSTSSDSWYSNLNYGMAHAYYNEKQFEKSLQYFKDYLKNGKSATYYEDAVIRLADCYYVTKNYPLAINYYQKAIDERNSNTDYAFFQKGVVHSINGNNSAANQSFDKVIRDYSSSNYYDNAIFQQALLAFESGQYESAIQGFSNLLKNLPQSPLRPFAYAKRALAYFNLKQYESAEKDYTLILQNYLTHATAKGALAGLQDLYSLMNKESDLDQYLTAYKQANPNDGEVTKIEFDGAQSLYFNQKYDRAISSFKAYIENYPDHSLAAEARYYLADSYYRNGQFDEALDLFYQVVADNNTSFNKRSIQKIAEIELEKQEFDKARLYFTKLLDQAENKKDKFNAYTGLLDIAKAKSDYSKMILYADLIIEKAAINANAINEAYLNKGMANYYQGKYAEAKISFQKAVDAAQDEFAAESQYMIALMEYNSKKHQESLSTLFELNKNFGSYAEWLGKSFLLIADNYFAIGETFQAKATLNSIIENADSKVLKDEAQLKLDLIKQEEEGPADAQDSTGNMVEMEEVIENDSTKN
ncbi:Tetratricopeptide repeat-containing protein [Marivirga sericea]|uniref:Tetratricopeptide repeat-containing protein n=1 Tax=Marivirga sericea TaxID=1028 RepID=A0A1X7IIK6_9BACT|nr:tetratricopeptide repeat protein [Marivirga sericea]SMG14713.1 Tetratricopeptide repeat-containing protein [Marivirga sericea]